MMCETSRSSRTLLLVEDSDGGGEMTVMIIIYNNVGFFNLANLWTWNTK